MPQMLMIILENIFKSLDHFEIDKTKVFVDITLSTFNFPDVSRELSAVHWQQTL